MRMSQNTSCKDESEIQGERGSGEGRSEQPRLPEEASFPEVVTSAHSRPAAPARCRGSFNRELHLQGDLVPPSELGGADSAPAPVKLPLFAVLGQQDAGVAIWGGENLERSFQIWMCGQKLHHPLLESGTHLPEDAALGSPEGQDTMTLD